MTTIDRNRLKSALAKELDCFVAEHPLSKELFERAKISPDPGYHDALREITRRTGTLLIIGETHTICAGPGGYTHANSLQPDMLTLGKPIASGVPAAVYGFTAEVAEQIRPLSTPVPNSGRMRCIVKRRRCQTEPPNGGR